MIRYALAALALVALTGCALPAPHDFAGLQTDVARRVEARVQWRGDGAQDKALDEALRELLSRELSADDAAQIALLNNRELAATFEELGVARADLVEAGLLKNPVFSAEVRFPGSPFELDVFADVLDLFILPLRKRVAEAQFEAAKARITDEVLKLWSEARAAYYEHAAAQQMLELRRSITLATDASADAAKRLHDAGNITDLELYNEQALREQARIELARAETEALTTRHHLSEVMGLWGTDAQRWKAAGRLPDADSTAPQPGQLESLAISQRADVAAARQELEALGRTYGLVRLTSLIPEVNVGLHNEREPEGEDTIGPSIEFPVPIFNHGQAARARAQAQIRQAQHRYYALAVRARSEVRSAHARFVSLRDQANYYRAVIIPLRHRIVGETQLQYNAMHAGVFQLLAAKQAEIEAGEQYVQTLRDYWVARTELERAVGSRLPGSPASTYPATAPSTQPQAAPSHEHHHH